MANTLKFGNGQWATKVGSTLAYNDENGNFKPLPFNFTRSTSATRVNKDGLIEVVTNNKPRIDFLNDSNGALLLEPTRSNLFTYSEDFSNASWLQERVTVSANATTAPDGSLTADKIIENTDSNSHRIRQNIPSTSGLNYSLSSYVKSAGRTKVRFFAGGINAYCDFDLTNGTIIGSPFLSTASIQNVGNGWYLCSISYLQNTTSGAQLHLFAPLDSSGNFSYTGNGTSGLYIWGAQLELGSYATSYIPTQGAIATRVVDACNNAGNNQVINSTEGVFYFEGSALADDGTNRFLSISDKTTNNYIYFRYVSTSNQYLFRTQVGGLTINSLSGFLTDTTQNHKFAFKFKSGDYAIWVDGVEISTDTSSTIFAANTLSNLEYSFPTDGGDGFQSKTRDLRIYNTALTDLQLQQLTTL